MLHRYAIVLLSVAFLAPLRPLHGQEIVAAGASASCGSDWWCAGVRAPLGFEVRTVTEGGRYLALDGAVWEVELSDRATAASWQAGDFVTVRSIAAPRDGYAWELTRTENAEQRAAVRPVGRDHPGDDRSDGSRQ